MALALELAACQKGYSVAFTTAAALCMNLWKPETSAAFAFCKKLRFVRSPVAGTIEPVKPQDGQWAPSGGPHAIR